MNPLRGLRTALVVSLLGLPGITSCGGDDDGGGADAAPSADGAPGSDGASGLDATAAACVCGDDEGCLTLVVGRTPDDANKPWVLWPKEADGVGTLIASASQKLTTLGLERVTGADYTAPATRHTIELGCLPAGTVTARVFLDDNGNAQAADTFSSDYRDTCLLDRAPEVTVAPHETTTLELALSNSCD